MTPPPWPLPPQWAGVPDTPATAFGWYGPFDWALSEDTPVYAGCAFEVAHSASGELMSYAATADEAAAYATDPTEYGAAAEYARLRAHDSGAHDGHRDITCRRC